MALFAVVLQEWAVGPVDVARVLHMLILHDLVEIECGDTPLFLTDSTQDERERLAADKVFGHLPAEQGRALGRRRKPSTRMRSSKDGCVPWRPEIDLCHTLRAGLMRNSTCAGRKPLQAPGSKHT